MLNPARVRLIAVGKVRKRWLQEGVDLYLRRLPGLQVLEVRDSTPDKEALAITALLKPEERLVVLTEDGKAFNSVNFAQELECLASEKLVLVLGGAEGISPALKARAERSWSLSAMTFPHEVARLLLLEQLYRAITIQQGGPYHKA